jgi:acyl-CoA thioester hydrolase
MEEMNIMLPARSLKINYLKSAHYDDLLTIRTIVDILPKVKFPIKTEIYNEEGELINSGETVLVFYNSLTNKPFAAPKFFIDELTRLFNNDVSQP